MHKKKIKTTPAINNQQISELFDSGKEQGFRVMAIVCDTRDYYDYPAFYHTVEDCLDDLSDFDEKYMWEHERLMEVYDLHGDKNAQLKTLRNMCFVDG